MGDLTEAKMRCPKCGEVVRFSAGEDEKPCSNCGFKIKIK